MRLTTANVDTASGHSIVVDLNVRKNDGQVILVSMMRDWRKAWVENIRYERPKAINHAWVLPQWAPPCDILVFRDYLVHRSWQFHGLTRRNVDDIISITVAKDQLAFIVAAANVDAVRVVENAIEAVKSSHAAGELPKRLFSESKLQHETRLRKRR